DRATRARAEVVHLAAAAPLEERHVACRHVAHVAEVAHGIEVAGAHDGFLAARLDARDLPGERRAHEGGVLPGSRLIERPGADDVEAVRAAALRGRQIRRRFARAVDGERTEWD